ncbi:MAG: MAPEG family protein [Mesorhizobium sp.]|nr:MAPEG family protein [Mesorhizobium sp.]
MSTELTILAWTLVLAIFQVLLAAQARGRRNGIGYSAGSRDTPPEEDIVAGRLRRAQANLFETLPLFAAAVLIAHVADREGALTLWGAWLFLAGRVLYVPFYALGISYARSAVWTVAFVGLCLVLAAILWPW